MGQTAGHIPPASRSSAEFARTLADTAGRRRAVIIAGHTGDVDTALAGTTDEAPDVRASALHALQRLDHLTRPIIDAAVADPDPKVRQAAALVAAAWTDRRGPEGPIDLLPLLLDPVAEVVEVAAWACGENALPDEDQADEDQADEDQADDRATVAPTDERVLAELTRLATSHDDALVREAAVAALGAIGDVRGLPAILQATTDKATVRRRAVIALAPFDGDEVDAALQQALTDRDWQVRQAAEDLLD